MLLVGLGKGTLKVVVEDDNAEADASFPTGIEFAISRFILFELAMYFSATWSIIH